MQRLAKDLQKAALVRHPPARKPPMKSKMGGSGIQNRSASKHRAVNVSPLQIVDHEHQPGAHAQAHEQIAKAAKTRSRSSWGSGSSA